jgi:hypothetical protein
MGGDQAYGERRLLGVERPPRHVVIARAERAE